MDRKGKGKQIAGAGSSSGKKRKGGVEFRDEGLRINSKRKKPGVLQFFEESAEVGYYGGSSDEECDMDDLFNDMENEPEVETSGKDDKGGKGKGSSSFVFPKEEEMNEDDYDRMMEERYKPGSGFVRYAADDVKSSIEMDALVPTAHDPPIWKIKCAIGKEKHSVFCLMHKFVELRKIGTKLKILSVFFVEHVKGFIFIEADKEQDVLEACMSLNGIYATRMMLLPKSEAPHLLTVQRKTKTFSEGTWARIKSGKYKGDLAQVVAVSDTRGKALIKLIPRIDIAALTQKYGGGVSVQKGLNPAPRLISSSELEEFRPIIQVRRDRDTGMTFEHLDSLMLKDGFVYKKVSLDSLTSCGVKPSKEEILKFTPLEEKETGDVEWISEIYGEEKKKKKSIPAGKGVEKGEASGGGKGEGSSESQSESSHELYNLVCFSRKDFGLIVGVDDKGDGYKVLKEGSDGPVVVSVGKKEMQEPFDSKFSALDLNNKQILIGDVVKIAKGPSEGKQGVVRQVYRGIIFLYAEGEEENGGYLCCKSQSCEKVKLFTEESNDKTGGFDASAFGDCTSSPKSPLSPEKEWQQQPKEKYINSNQGDKGSMYSIGQKLRIRVGPLKGYLCRVIALRYSDITVKLDSQHKIFTVKSEHLAEVRDRNTVPSMSGDAGMGSFQQFDMIGTTEGNNGDWAKGAGTSEDNTTTWGNTAAENKPDSAGDQSAGWNAWGKPPAPEASTVGTWGDASTPKVEASWGKQGASTSNVEDSGSWGKHGGSSDGNKQNDDSAWGKLVEESSQKKEESSWGKKTGSDSDLGKGNGESTWGNKDGNSSASNKEGVSWGQQDKGSDGNQGGSSWGKKNDNVKDDGGSSWGKKDDGGSTWGKKDDGGSSWGKKVDDVIKDDGESSWGKKVEGNKDDGRSSWGKKVEGNKDDGGSSWGKKVEGNKDDGGSAWGKKVDCNKDDGESAWGKKVDCNKDDGGSSWGKKDDGNKDEGSSWGKKVESGSSWGNKDGGSSWAKKDDGGSSWGKKDDGGYSEQTFDRGGRGFGGRRGGGRRGGRDQFGRGRSFGHSEDQAPWSKPGGGGGSSWGKQDNGGGGSSWGKDNDAGGGSSWSKQNNAGGGGGSSWSKDNDAGGGSSWGKQNNSGGGGSSWGQEKDAGGGSSWGKQGSDGGGSSWGKKNDASGGGSSWGKQGSDGGGSSWGKESDGGGSSWGQENNAGGGGSSWGKQGSDGGGSSWGKKSDVGGGGSSFGQENNAGGGSSWGKQGSDGGGSSWGKKNDAGGGGGSSWGQQGGGGGSAWGKQNNDGGGGQSWSKQDDGGSKPWGEQSGGRGFGGRRGGGFRGGFRGGRNQSGRDGGGRSFESSGWKRDNQENTTWKSNQSGGSDWKKGWGEDSNSAKPSDSSSAGGNWGSWDTSSKKETNAGGAWGSNSKKETIAGAGDKPSNENKAAAAWGTTANDQENAGNNNDGWGKKPSDDVKTSGEADNAWGGKTNAGASSSSGSAW
ncbi:PREDICTED: protein RNA-directed DNA methylation 3 [Brassica oleracea var. oleracea]|uniref:KOW domain-containing protein n=1 Tax=Brassica oleracea var. oleracea TaxID=109376 RepID=A0A0D3EHY5_BRAOL|nr:PREDICTED: protein RNA-directed DNA methylation 3 [Brassica oleracea var. oleracea]